MLNMNELIDQIHDAVIVTDLDSIITLWNKGAEKQLGYSANDVIGRPIYSLYPGSENNEFSQSDLISLLKEKGEFQFESVMTKKCGDIIHVHTSLSPLKDNNGDITGVVSYTLDITKQKRNQEQLRQQAMMIDQIHDAIIVTDLDSIIIQWNKGAELQLGYTSEETLGRPVYFLYPESEQNFSQSDLISILRKNNFIEFEAIMRKKTGEDISVNTSLSPIVDDTGNITSVISYTLDITKLKKAETAQREKEIIERDLDIAKNIQQGLLPSEPLHIKGFQIAGFNQAADQTGGDYFDWLELPDGRITISIADVSGHGIGPALIVAVCRAYFRASTSVDDSLISVMSSVNDLLCRDLSAGRFVTAAVGLLDPSNAIMHFYSAGHAPIFFFSAAKNDIIQWGADDPPLGIMEGATSNQPRELKFISGDILVLVTDGFFEWANLEGERFGIERLKDVIKKYNQLNSQDLINVLHEEVLGFSKGSAQIDDLTVVVVKRE
jgi:PAS domain S-box-containing protein